MPRLQRVTEPVSTEDLKPVCEYFYQTCGKFPSRPAQRFNADLYHGDNNGRFTYAEMRERAEDIACGILSLGHGRRERVGIMSRPMPYWTHVDMAVAGCAGVSVAVCPTLSSGEVTRILSDSKSRMVFVDTEENLDKVLSRIDELPDLGKIVVMDVFYSSRDDRTMGLGELIEAGRTWRKSNSALYEERRASVTLDDWYTILYTPGTTGRSRGVVLSNRCVSSRIEGVRDFFSHHGMAITHEDVGLCHLPLSHIFERGSCELLAICQGACIAYADNPATLLKDMQRYNPTWMNCEPRLYEKIFITFQEKMYGNPLKKKLFDLAFSVGRKALDYRRDHRGTYNMSPDYDLEARLPFSLGIRYKLAERLFFEARSLFGSRFRFALSAGADIAPDLLRFFYTLGIAVVEDYGSTESAGACLLNPVRACKPASAGIEANASFARIADDGELEITGAGVFSEYLNLPEETRKSFTDDGWYRTGDIVEVDHYGYYRIVDRKKAVIEDMG